MKYGKLSEKLFLTVKITRAIVTLMMKLTKPKNLMNTLQMLGELHTKKLGKSSMVEMYRI